MNKRFAWLFATMWLLVVSIASAASSKGKGVVMIIEGPDADVTQRELTQSLPEGMAAQPASDLTSALASQGVSGSLADSLANPKARKAALAGVRKALAQAGVAAVISARSKKAGKAGAREVRVVLLVASQTQPVVEENIALAKGEKGSTKFQPLISVPLQEVASAPAAAESPKVNAHLLRLEEISKAALPCFICKDDMPA